MVMIEKSVIMKGLRSEDDIISGWKECLDQPLVTIICVTYNHAPYIEGALASFLAQETDYRFEIVIHDDASTDGTTDIVEQYASAYPGIIKAVAQSENQYSKGRRPLPIALGYVSGRYIALCEGDDYWTDNNKLQKQREAIEKSGASVVFHSALELNEDDGGQKLVANHRESDSVIPLGESIIGRGAFMPTASLFFKAEALARHRDFFAGDLPIGDFFLQVLLGCEGKIFYINSPMCVYRRNSSGSWTESHKNKEKARKYYFEMTKGIVALSRHLKGYSGIVHLAHPLFFYSLHFNRIDKDLLISILGVLMLPITLSAPFRLLPRYYCLMLMSYTKKIVAQFKRISGNKA